MANTIPSPNMNLPIPVVGVDPGPNYAADNNSCFTILDAHTHAAGSGIPITPDGLNINADLSIGNNNLISIRSVRLSSQGSALNNPSDLDCLYVVSNDLYYNDGLGNQVRITQSGGVAGSTGSISNLNSPASASYVAASSNFVWQSATNASAAMDNGAIIIRETGAVSAKGITIQSPNSLAANYSITLPTALPIGSTAYLTLGTGGNVSFTTPDAIGQAMSSVGANALAVSRTRATGTSVGTGGVGISLSCGTYTFTTSKAAITNLSILITTSGRPVFIGMTSASSSASAAGILELSSSTTTAATPTLYFQRGGADIALYTLTATVSNANTIREDHPASAFYFIDTPAAGTYTYAIQGKIAATTGGASTILYESKLVVYEL